MISIVAAVIALGGCSHGENKSTTEEVRAQTPHAEADTQGGAATAMSTSEDINCPMQVPGTTVHAEETTSGPALAFSTTGDVTELRARVERMAAAQNRAIVQSSDAPNHADNPAASSNTIEGMGNPNTSNSPSLQGGSVGTQGVMPRGKGAPPTGKARAEDIENGSRLVFVAEDGGQLDQLRDRVQSNAKMLASGKCPMMPMTSTNEQSTGGGGY